MRRWRARESGWSRVGFPIVLGAGIAVLVGSLLASVDEVVTGPAIVRPEGRRSIAADISGSAEVVLVVPGDHVEPNQVLARVAPDPALEAEVERLQRELDATIARLLFDASDAPAARGVAELEAALLAAKRRIEGGVVRATASATVADVHKSPGQKVASGEAIVTVVPDDAPIVVAAFLPARERTRLVSGQQIEVLLRGAPGETTVSATIESIDASSPGAPSVVARGRLPGATLASEARGGEGGERGGNRGRTAVIPLAGRTGTASVVLRTEPVLFTLVPNLRARPRRG